MGDIWDIKGRYKEKMNTESRGNRGIFAGGQTPSDVNIIDYIEIATAGNSVDFGDFITGMASSASLSNSHGGL